jgi:hypothetical protein
MDIASISNNVLDEASQAMDSGVYLVQCVRCPTVPNSCVIVGNTGFRAVFIMRWCRIVVSFLSGKKIFLQNIPDCSVHHPASSSMGNGGRGVSLSVRVI